MDVRDKDFHRQDVLRECSLPSAPMAMPEQALTRQHLLRNAFRPLLQWLIAR